MAWLQSWFSMRAGALATPESNPSIAYARETAFMAYLLMCPTNATSVLYMMILDTVAIATGTHISNNEESSCPSAHRS